jgi:F-type H+-transporting ATPase subunit alpha
VTHNEEIVFEDDSTGQVLSITKDIVEVMTFSRTAVRLGAKAARSGKKIMINLGAALPGTVVDPFGKLLSTKHHGQKAETKSHFAPIDIAPPILIKRMAITKPFFTGVSAIDLLVPIGSGQRELIVGDRKTGKTLALLSAIQKQAQLGTYIIYTMIGKQFNEVKRMQDNIEKLGIADKVTIVATMSNESPSLIMLTPYSAMTIAEYYCGLGHDVMVILDDLTNHAKYYRQVSLIARRFPGRESYPADVFYAHARLLERAGSFKYDDKGNASITVFPIAESVDSSLASYIVSNLISITDGHLLFDQSLFQEGRRPAISPSLSVTRVGKQTQSIAQRELTQRLLAFLTEYDRIKKYTHFGSELSDEIHNLLEQGSQLINLLNQSTLESVSTVVQMIVATAIINGTLKGVKPELIRPLVSKLAEIESKEKKSWLESAKDAKSLKELMKLVEDKKEIIKQLCQT